jgi:hypothetical protein
MGKDMKIINWEQGFFVYYRIAPAVNRVEYVSDMVSYVIMRGRWCIIIVLNVHEPREEKRDDTKESFYEQIRTGFLIPFLSII